MLTREIDRDENGKPEREQFLVKPSIIDFDVVTPRRIQLIIASLIRSKDGADAARSTHDTARSAIADLYRSHGRTMPTRSSNSLSRV